MSKFPYLTLLSALALAPSLLYASPAESHPEIRTEDVTRFYAFYDMTEGHPTIEQIQTDYLDKGTQSLTEFAALRRVTAQRIVERINSDPAIYRQARKCLDALPAVKKRLISAFAKLAELYPNAKFPPVAIVVGRGRPVGITNPAGVTIGLEALCATEVMNPNIEDRFTHVIAHEYAHIQQADPAEFEPGDPTATVLRVALAEGGAELVAELISGKVANGRHAAWTHGKEAEIEAKFVREMHGTDLSNWFMNYRNESEPFDLGYWVGYRITKMYYLRAKDRKAALKEILAIDDPKAFLAKSGWAPGRQWPGSESGD